MLLWRTTWVVLVATLAIVCACCVRAASEAAYAKTIALPALRISFVDLQNVLDKAAILRASANESSIPKEASDYMARRYEVVEGMEVSRGDLSIKIEGHRLDVAGARIPSHIDEFEYSSYYLEEMPISAIRMEFSDYRRTLLVQGSSPEHVDAVFSTLRDDLTRISNRIGGSSFRSLLIFPVALLPIVCLVFVKAATSARQSIQLGGSIGLLWLLCVFLFFSNDVLAGFSAIRGDASFLVMYGPQISFWGLVLGIVSIVLAIYPLPVKGQVGTAPRKGRGKQVQ